MQTVSSNFVTNETSATQTVDYGILISWTEQINSSYEFFTIGTSIIGGPDVIKGGGSEVTFLDRYQYSDYTEYGLSIDIKNSIGQYPYGTIMRQAEVKLDNTQLTFMPGHDPTIGAYILPNRPVKLSTGLSGEMITMFAGYSTAPINQVSERETKLTCYDGMGYLNMTVSTGSGPLAQQNNGVYVNAYAQDIIADLLTEAGFASTDYVLEQSLQQPIGYLSPINFETGTNVNGNIGSIGYIISALCEAEMGIFFFDENGTAHFWNRQHIVDNKTVQWSFDYSESLGGNNTGIISYNIENTEVINNVQVQANPRTVVANQQVWQLAQPVSIPANGTAVISADFSDNSGSLPVTTLDTPILYNPSNAVSSSFECNLNSDGSATQNVGSSLSCTSVVLSGSNAKLTFTNTYQLPIWVTAMVLYGTPAKVLQTINQTYTNPSSIALYGINPANNGEPLQIQNNLIQDPLTANSIAYQLVNDYSTPLQRMSLEVMAAPQLQFGDYITVLLNDINQTLNYTIVGIEFSQTRQDPFKQVIEAEVKQMITYFTIGTSVVGGTDQIAP